MIPGDTVTRTFEVVNSGGTSAGCSGFVSGDFVLDGYRNGVASTITPTIANIGQGTTGWRYSIAYTLPSSAGLVDGWPALRRPGFRIVWPPLSGEVEADDLVSVKAAVVRTVSVLNATGAPTNALELSVIKDTYHTIVFTVKNSDGSAVDLSAFTGWTLGVKNQTQTTSGAALPYALATGITATALGVVTILLPETALVFGALAVGTDATTDLYWSLRGDEGGDVTKSRVMARGRFVINRMEN